MSLKYRKELYPRVALIKAAYNFSDQAYCHLDADDDYFYVTLTPKEGCSEVLESDFENEMLAQSVRHQIYDQTKNIREILLARAMATSVLLPEVTSYEDDDEEMDESEFEEEDVLRDWFE